jgi:MFS family permease
MKSTSSPFAIRNVRLFIAFRVLFNARFYYPVFTILFLDYGLTIEQFALLNTVWALVIVLAEVPSGALADILGRKYLLVGTAVIMTAEMCLLAFVPLGNATLIFAVFLVNRVLSGLAEAMASGADEAIAYDSLLAEGKAEDWPRVLSLQMVLRSIAAVVTMTAGALIYDPAVVNSVLAWFGSEQTVDQQVTMRFPIYLTLVLAILATACALAMGEKQNMSRGNHLATARAAMGKIGEAGKWLARSPFALAIILFGTLYDHVLRMIVTLTSQYFRLIDLPEASFGLIGSAISLVGLATPKLAQWMIAKNTPFANMWWVSGLSLLALAGLVPFYPYFGLLPMALVFMVMMLVSFFTSHYLNLVTESHQRATVLSFKGLAFNLAYGAIGLLFAVGISELRQGHQAGLDAATVENLAFRQAISYFPWYALFGIVVTLAFCWHRLRISGDRDRIHRQG